MVEKIVLAGGPSCGKTSIVRELATLGYPVVHEVARQVLTERKPFPLTSEENRYRQYEIARRQLAAEHHVLTQDHGAPYLFLDRSIIDNPAYCELFLGHVPQEIDEVARSASYDLVFIPDLLPFKADGLRAEKDQEEARIIHERVICSYQKYGYTPIYLPVIEAPTTEEAVTRRVDAIFTHLQQRKKSVETYK